VSYTIGSVVFYQKNLSLEREVERATILVKVGCSIEGVAVTQLVRFLSRFYRGVKRGTLIRRVHRILDELEAEGLVFTEVVGRYRFVRLTLAGWRELVWAVDLIKDVISTKLVGSGGLKTTLTTTLMSGRSGASDSEGKEGPLKEVPLDRKARKALEELVEEYEDRIMFLRQIPKFRASYDWWVVARTLYTKDLDKITEFDKERLGLTFEAWKDEAEEKVIVFLDEEGNMVIMDYITRFTSEKKAKELIWKYNVAWDIATILFDSAVFVTITLPPIMTLREMQYTQTFVIHRLKAHLRKKYGGNLLFSDEVNYLLERFSHKEVKEMILEINEVFSNKRKVEEVGEDLRELLEFLSLDLNKENLKVARDVLVILKKIRKLKTPPHIRSYEPQTNLAPHMHLIIYGIKRIMDKREFTLWLDQVLVNFFSNMGHHVKKTVNNKISNEEVRWLNKRGKKLLKKYMRYKKKHKGYRGPVNWLTPIKRKKVIEETENGRRVRYYWEFTNPPPDYVKFLQEQMEKRANGEKGGFEVGNYGSPADYVKKYLIKNLKEIVEEGMRNAGLIGSETGLELEDGSVGDAKGPSIEKSELRKVWEKVGEILGLKTEEDHEKQDKSEEDVELKMVDNTTGKERKKRKKGKKKRRKNKSSSWGSRIRLEKDKRKRRLISSIKMGWYWLTRTPFYTVSPIFRKPKPKKEKAGWEFFGVWRVEDLDRLMWLEKRNRMGVW